MKRLSLSLALSIFLLPILTTAAAAQEPVVHAVFFYGPECPHCHQVITEVFPLLFNTYGGDNIEINYMPPESPEDEELENKAGPSIIEVSSAQLRILYVNLYWPIGRELYDNSMEMYGGFDGVPRLIVGDTALIGGADIPGQFPGIIETGLAEGGIAWPDLPQIDTIINKLIPLPTPTAQPSEEPASGVTQSPESSQTLIPITPTTTPESIPPIPDQNLTVIDRIKLDLTGNIISILVLLGMVASVIYAGVYMFSKPNLQSESWRLWSVLALGVLGIGVASYLAHIETTGSMAVCGPIGDCNTVNHSEYVLLFNFLPIAVFGLIGYIAILITWIIAKTKSGIISDLALLAILAMTCFGTIFSIYLTFLEPFVIGATCAWCLSSAIDMTAMMLISLPPGMAAWHRLKTQLT